MSISLRCATINKEEGQIVHNIIYIITKFGQLNVNGEKYFFPLSLRWSVIFPNLKGMERSVIIPKFYNIPQQIQRTLEHLK